jgi:hypothetical protein
MSSVDEGLRSQIRNIEATYGRTIGAWVELIRASGKTKHTEVVAMLKSEHGMTHGSAHRVALVARGAIADEESSPPADPEDQLYQGGKAGLRPVHDRLMASIRGFGGDIDLAAKKGYLSIRRRKQFAMIQPAAARVDVGLILKGVAVSARLESAASFNALFTHRVRVNRVEEVDDELTSWLREAYQRAG